MKAEKPDGLVVGCGLIFAVMAFAFVASSLAIVVVLWRWALS